MEEKRQITKWDDYAPYLMNTLNVSNDPIQEELKFWENRLKQNKQDEASLIKLAGLNSELFKSTGLIHHIFLSDSLYNLVLKQYPAGSVEIYHSLSANAISQHRFHSAKIYAEKALALKDKKAASLLILVDVSLELGDYATTNRILQQFTNKSSFAYLIRKAKIEDHEGKLDSAILCMERAHVRIKGNKSLSQWTLSNLGDMYGHAGRLEDAYQTYLKVLQMNPTDDYALKGIAWIAISHDKDTSHAKTIVKALAERKRMPEAHLMLAEIAEIEGHETEKLDHLKKFKELVSVPVYKTMYHKYLATLEAEAFNNAEAGVDIAKEEIINRSTPQSYDLLAWGYYHEKKFKKALDIGFRHVENQTFEPDAIYHLGMIYLANGYKEQARHYLLEALESEFELGPSITKKIKATIQNL
jgi:tetratricopeptide (TPR) repeat protein